MRDFKQIYMYTIYINKTPKNPAQKKQNEFESRIEKCIKRKTNKKKSIKAFQINN